MQETSLYKSSRRVGLLGSDSRTPLGIPTSFIGSHCSHKGYSVLGSLQDQSQTPI